MASLRASGQWGPATSEGFPGPRHGTPLWGRSLNALLRIPRTKKDQNRPAMKKRAPDEVFLSRSVTVADYRSFKDAKDRHQIADFLYERLHGRYIKPFASAEHKHGFAMMVCACLLVETMEAFWTGTAKSGTGAQTFTDFFNRVDHFASLREHGKLFTNTCDAASCTKARPAADGEFVGIPVCCSHLKSW